MCFAYYVAALLCIPMVSNMDVLSKVKGFESTRLADGDRHDTDMDWFKDRWDRTSYTSSSLETFGNKIL